MILVAVGTQLPFDRMIQAVDEWAERAGRTDVVAQIGKSDYRARAIKTFQFMDFTEFSELQAKADFLIGHAGIGSILTALQLSKPIVIMPRDHHRGEHRDGHQFATAKSFAGTPGIYVAADEQELVSRLDNLNELSSVPPISDKASDELIEKLREFVAVVPARRSLLDRLLARNGAGRGKNGR